MTNSGPRRGQSRMKQKKRLPKINSAQEERESKGEPKKEGEEGEGGEEGRGE